jgi:hypothetical protein
MSSQTITLDLPDHLYQAATRLAQATQRPLHDVLQDTLAHALPPLDDVSPEEADVLAHMSSLDDPALWQASRATMLEGQQDELRTLLDAQGTGDLTPDQAERLQGLMDEYGRLLVRQAHAWLLLARRGYRVPIQPSQE